MIFSAFFGLSQRPSCSDPLSASAFFCFSPLASKIVEVLTDFFGEFRDIHWGWLLVSDYQRILA